LRGLADTTPPSPACCAGHLKKRLPGRASEGGGKRLRALAGLALADSDDEEEEEAAAELPRSSSRRGRHSYSDDEDEEEEDEEAVLRSLHSAKLARTASGAGVASPRTASLAGGSPGARRGGTASDGRRHVTRAATGSLRPRHFGEEAVEGGSDEEQYDASLDPEEMYLLQARQHARGAASRGAPAAGRPGASHDSSSQHTRSTTEHCSEQEGGAAFGGAWAAPPPFLRSLSSHSGSTGGAQGWLGCADTSSWAARLVPCCGAAKFCCSSTHSMRVVLRAP
jgi:hypothetical protein